MGLFEDIFFLKRVVMPELKAAFFRGGKNYSKVSVEHAPVAHRVFRALDGPSKSIEWHFFENPNPSVKLDPYTVLNRSQSFEKEDVTIDDLEFWEHGDMIKTLGEWIIENPEIVEQMVENANSSPRS